MPKIDAKKDAGCYYTISHGFGVPRTLLSWTYKYNCHHGENNDRPALENGLVSAADSCLGLDDVGLLLLHIDKVSKLTLCVMLANCFDAPAKFRDSRAYLRAGFCLQ